VTWPDYRSGANSDIYGHHVLGTGDLAPWWLSNGGICATLQPETNAIRRLCRTVRVVQL